MQTINAAQSLDWTLPSAAYLFGSIVFSIIGFAAFRFGKRTQGTNAMIIGVAMMLYPYFISSTWLLYAVGASFCSTLYFFRD